MVEVALTIDYEIYGNGQGSLRDHVYKPTEELLEILRKRSTRMVIFAEAAELEMIEKAKSDSAIHDVNTQLRSCVAEGHEIALHLHPQWYNARFDGVEWHLDYSEYNLCTLPASRIAEILKRSVSHLRTVLRNESFSPTSFRAGNWLFQPTKEAAAALTRSGIKIDSSVFKGGLQRRHGLDYRPAQKNGPYWRFQDDVNIADSTGSLLEIPIYTTRVPFWRMATGKRIALQKRASTHRPSLRERILRFCDFARFYQPLKFDFCRMTLDELVSITKHCIQQDKRNSNELFPMVAIGHSKDLVDFKTIDDYLAYLKSSGIKVSTLKEWSDRIGSSKLTSQQEISPELLEATALS